MSRKTRVFLLLISGLVVIGGTTIALVSATAGSTGTTATTSPIGPPNSVGNVDQNKLQQCEAQQATNPTGSNCTDVVPGLADCMAQGLQCNVQAMNQRIAEYPPAQAPAAGAPVTSQTQAIQAALGVGAGIGASTSGANVVARQMTMSDAVSLLAIAKDPLISADRPVWVVSVDAPVGSLSVPSGHTAVTHPYYTVVMDGYTDYLIVAKLGVDSLGSAGASGN